MRAPFKSIVIRSPFVDELDRFARLADDCVRAGVTHLTFTEIEPSFWEIEDPMDPYPHWAIVHTSLFKVFPPDILSGWVPADYAARARESIAARAAILKKVGLKGASFLYDPMRWPERIFRAHPELRGPRTDAPTQCAHPAFAPCVDRPEVLAMYRAAFRQLYELSDGVLDIVAIRTNDSGTGFCWSSLYNGRNGPLACRGVPAQTRVNTFLDECLGGVREAGGQARIFVQGSCLGVEDAERSASSLPASCGIYSHNKGDKGGERILSGFPTDFSLYPIRHIPSPLETLERLVHAHARQWPEIILFTCPTMYGNDWDGDISILKVIEHYNRKPRARLLERMELAVDVAAELHGQENAADMVEAWWLVRQAAEILQKSTIGMADLIFYGCMAQRWLTRPLAVFPERLSAEEKAHYQPFLFQANARRDSLDVLDQSAIRQFDGARHLAYFNRHFNDACQKYRLAAQRVGEVFRRGGERREELRLRLASMEALECFLLNIHNTVNFQILLEGARTKAARAAEAAGGGGAPAERVSLPEEKRALGEIVRSEIDNSLRLANLLEKEPGLLELAGGRAEETPFMFGPDIVADLRHKAEIMLDRFEEVDELTGFSGGSL